MTKKDWNSLGSMDRAYLIADATSLAIKVGVKIHDVPTVDLTWDKIRKVWQYLLDCVSD